MPLDPEAKAILDFFGITERKLELMTPEAARASTNAVVATRNSMGVEAVDEVRDFAIPGPGGAIPVRLYRPGGASTAPVLIYFHGGGWVIGNIESHDHICRGLANATPCVVISVDYRLGPEARFPAAVEDAYAAT